MAQMTMTITIPIIMSKTQLPLWGNRVPDTIYQTIKEQSNIRTRKEVETLCRHNSVMINAFCEVYGEYLERCEYAILKGLPYLFQNFYAIVQIPLYGTVLYPETAEIKVDECLSFYRNTDVYKEVENYIRYNTNRCPLCIMYRGFIPL